ncbi:MAG: PfkB family carbohydrate kinase, partial [Sphaerochaeta sp.]|nr:PfkB family carbohydrate kinase [Sphaerochaeta sp.]
LDIRVPAIDNPIVDTVGAGDTVSGALLTYLEEHDIGIGDTVTREQATEALEFAAAAAAVTTSRKGANPPRRSEIAYSI